MIIAYEFMATIKGILLVQVNLFALCKQTRAGADPGGGGS